MGLFGSAAGKGRQPSDQSCHINWEAWMFIAAVVAFKPWKVIRIGPASPRYIGAQSTFLALAPAIAPALLASVTSVPEGPERTTASRFSLRKA